MHLPLLVFAPLLALPALAAEPASLPDGWSGQAILFDLEPDEQGMRVLSTDESLLIRFDGSLERGPWEAHLQRVREQIQREFPPEDPSQEHSDTQGCMQGTLRGPVSSQGIYALIVSMLAERIAPVGERSSAPWVVEVWDHGRVRWRGATGRVRTVRLPLPDPTLQVQDLSIEANGRAWLSWAPAAHATSSEGVVTVLDLVTGREVRSERRVLGMRPSGDSALHPRWPNVEIDPELGPIYDRAVDSHGQRWALGEGVWRREGERWVNLLPIAPTGLPLVWPS